MKSIDIKELGLDLETIDEMLKENVVSIDDCGTPIFYVVPAEVYDSEIGDFCPDSFAPLDQDQLTPNVKIIGPEGASLTYEQYKAAREQLISAFDKFFKPDAEKMN